MDRNDLISRSALKEDIVKLCRQINASNGITVPTLAFTRVIDNAPTVPLPDFKEGYKQAILDGKLNCGGQVVPENSHIEYIRVSGVPGLYKQEVVTEPDKQITIEEYMQSLKGEN